MFCPLKQMEFSTRSVQLHAGPMDMPGVLSKVTGAREGRRVLLTRILAMGGISVESLEISENRHTTVHMVR